MRVILAPMEGVLDALVRRLLCEINQYDLCITEFLRVVDSLLPEKSFYRLCPELHHGSRTPDGTPVRIQLLGQSPEWLAENAARAVALGSFGVDFNCGCPSKTVNGSGGGATLLKQPELIFQAVRAMRAAIPVSLPLSVKIRLGWDDVNQSHEIADAAALGGASELAIHGRTREQGYRAECINWPAIGEIRRRLTIPVIANGEVMDWASGQACLAASGCEALMVGRGALNLPNLSLVVKHNASPLAWPAVVALLQRYTRLEKQGDTGLYHLARIKQWLGYLRKHYPQAEALFFSIRGLRTSAEVAMAIGRL